jgi:AAA+ ATPase superfamily predicted ATPase
VPVIPFKYGQVVTGNDYCDREPLQSQVKELISSRQNIVLLGERRVGKTSLIHEVSRKLGKKVLYCDFWAVNTIDDVCKRIFKGIFELEKKDSWHLKILKMLSGLKPVLSIDPLTLMPELSFESSPVAKHTESIIEALRVVREITNDHTLVVFDEFQGLMKVPKYEDLLTLMRSEIQFHGAVSYAFVGSIRHKMDKFFTNPDSPMYNSALRMTVDTIPRATFVKFLKKKFRRGKRSIDDSIFDQVYSLTNGVPGDIQCLCEALWSVSSESDHLNDEAYRRALLLIFSREKSSYEDKILALSNNQLKCLKAIARLGGANTMSSAFLAHSGISTPSSVQSALERLQDINILYNKENEYRFFDPFFKAWILHAAGL